MSKTLIRFGRQSVEFKPSDLWIGAYYDRRPGKVPWTFHTDHHLYICVVPMLPLHFCWKTKGRRKERRYMEEAREREAARNRRPVAQAS